MKTKLLNVLVILMFFSCSTDDNKEETKDNSLDTYPQEWVLFKEVAGFSGEIINHGDLTKQENYTFNEDNSFTKQFPSGADKSIASGSFETVEDNQYVYLILTFDSGNDLINSCGDGNQEILYFQEPDVLVNSGWQSCDGPGLYYKPKK